MTTPKRSHPVVVIVTNPQSEQPLSLRMVATTPFRRGEPATIRVIAEGGTGGYVYGIGKGSFPPGMGTLDPVTGISTGTPTTAGHYEFSVEVQDSSATVWTERFTVDVVSRLTPGEVTPVVGEVGVPYNYQLTVRGATGTVTWRRISGTLPAGLTLPNDGPGTITGTPANPFGRSYVTVRATDSGSGDTLDVALVFDIARRLDRAVYPADLIEDPFTVGRPTEIAIERMWHGGVPPYRVTPDAVEPPPFNGTFVRSKRTTGWVMRASPSSPSDVQFGAMWVEDALGAKVKVVFGASAAPLSGLLLSKRVGMPDVIASAPRIYFDGPLVQSVDPVDDGVIVRMVSAVTAIGVSSPITSSGGSSPTIGHATSGVAAGTYTYPAITVNATGHITSISNGALPVTSVGATSPIVSSGGTSPTLSHVTSGVSAGTYALATITVNAHGHVTSASAGSIPATAWGTVVGSLGNQTDLQLALNAKAGLSSANTWTASQSFSAGVSFGSFAAAANTDLSRHIALYGSTYGICVSSGRLNYVSNGIHVFIAGGTDRVTISSTGMTVVGSVSATSLQLSGTTAQVLNGNGSTRNVTISTSAPTGGADGDIWYRI